MNISVIPLNVPVKWKPHIIFINEFIESLGEI